MGNGRTLLVVGLVALLGVGAARAEDTTTTAEADKYLGWYVTAQGLYAFENFHHTDPLEGDNGLGFKGRIGYRFMDMLAAEGEIEWVNLGLNIPAGVGSVTGGGQRLADITYHTFTLNMRVYPPADARIFDGKLDPFLLGGVGFANADVSGQGIDGDSATRFAARAGAGIMYHITDHVAVIGDAEYVASTNELQDLGYLSVGWGLEFTF